jgi:hypothetical protein
MSREKKLRDIFKDIDEGKRKIVDNLITEAVFLEEQMQKLKQYPFIKFHPTNPELQKVTAAGKQYREFLQTYVNLIDKLCRYYSNEEIEEDSPLRAFMKTLSKE